MALVLATTLFSLVSPTESPAWPDKVFNTRHAWCGNAKSSDQICRWRGHAYVDGQLLPKRRVQPLPRRTKVFTPTIGMARLSLGNEALCTVGGGGLPSEVITRWEGTLIKQLSGDASCTNLKTGLPIETLCDPAGECSAAVRARGTYLSHVVPPPEATASMTDTLDRRVRLVVCTGHVRVRVENESGYSEASGMASGGNRFVILIEETRTLTHDETVTENGAVAITEGRSSSVNLNVIGTMLGPGPCDSSFVEEQEHTVTP